MESRDEPKIPKTERLLNLVAFLLRSRRSETFEEIRLQVNGYTDAVPLKVLERRFERDKQELRRLGVPIEYQPDAGGYTIPKQRYFLAPFELSAEDALLLRALVQMAEGGPLPAEEVQAAARKLAFDSQPSTDVAAQSGDEVIMLLPGHGGDEAFQAHFLELAEAVGARRRLKLRYAGQKSVQELEPWGLGFASGAWSLVGCCPPAEELQVFRIDRIDSLTGENDTGQFEVPEDFDIGPYLNRQSWELGDAAQQEVCIELQAPYAWHARETLGNSARFEELPDGGGRLRLAVRDLDAFMPWLLERLAHVRRIEPASLRRRVADALVRIEALYAEGKG